MGGKKKLAPEQKEEWQLKLNSGTRLQEPACFCAHQPATENRSRCFLAIKAACDWWSVSCLFWLDGVQFSRTETSTCTPLEEAEDVRWRGFFWWKSKSVDVGGVLFLLTGNQCAERGAQSERRGTVLAAKWENVSLSYTHVPSSGCQKVAAHPPPSSSSSSSVCWKKKLSSIETARPTSAHWGKRQTFTEEPADWALFFCANVLLS